MGTRVLLWALLGVLLGCIGTGTPSRGAGDDPAKVKITVLEALGLGPAELTRMMDRNRRSGQHDYVHTFMTLQNENGDYLADTKVKFTWDGGSQEVDVPRTALIHFDIDRAKLKGLKIEAPAPYVRLKQRTLHMGQGFDGDADKLPRSLSELDESGDLIDDEAIMERLRGELARLASSGKAIPSATLAEQLHRQRAELEFPSAPAEISTPAEIYRRRRDSVVIIGSQAGQNQMSVASGVVINPDGVIVTNYHVLERAEQKSPVVFGVLLRRGGFYPIVEVLAASRPADVAIVRIEAKGLTAAPLARSAEVGGPVTVISHPSDHFFCLTQGVISRYQRFVNYGRLTARMAITADYAVGSSGGPVFDEHGAVVGIVATTNAIREQMVFKECPPVQEIWALIEDGTKDRE